MSDLSAKNFRIESAMGQSFSCSCGRVHKTNLRDYVMEADAIERLPRLLEKYGAKRIFMVADINTMTAAGNEIAEILKKNPAFDTGLFVYDDEELVPDDSAVARLREAGETFGAADLWLAVGSGTLNDLTRFVSHEMGLPYMVFATAPSMDGYASGVSPLIIDRMKQTFNAQSPLAIVSSPEVLAKAPAAMLQAGAGDVFGKFTSLLDWSLARILFNEYYCPEIVAMVERSRDAVASSVTAIRKRDPEAIRLLFDALVEVGIAMDYCGNSRPASGAEHHLAHFWEMQFLFSSRHPVLHGLKVGAALPVVLGVYEQLASLPLDFDFDEARRKARQFDEGAWLEGTKQAYGPAAGGIIKLAEDEALLSVEGRLERIDRIEAKWPELIALAKTAPRKERIGELYKELSFPASVAELGVGEDLVDLAMTHARDLRSRYTILRLFEDLGIEAKY